MEISHEETLLTGQVAYLQAALLYTNSVGERRIRVHTVALPVVSGAQRLRGQGRWGLLWACYRRLLRAARS